MTTPTPDVSQSASRLNPEDAALVNSLAGHSIMAAEWLDSIPNEEWANHKYALLTLDDGRVIQFKGHVACGAMVTSEKATGS